MRLLNLPENIQKMIIEGKLSAGHGRMLASITDESKLQELVSQILEQGLTVRDIENAVAQVKNKKNRKRMEQDIEITNLVEDLQRVYGTKISITGNGKKGKIILNYFNLEDLERISAILKRG